jgi:hypothetical protein
MKVSTRILLASVLLALGTSAACDTTTHSSGDPASSHVGLSLETSTRELTKGEIVTIIARSEDTYGRESKISWTTTSGDLTTEQNGRVARIRFEEAGTYTVTAVLMIDGREARRATVDIHVKPLS